MSTAETGLLTGAGRASVDRAPTHPGRIVVKERVLRKVAEETAARTLRVDRDRVSVGVSEARGGLAVAVSAPLPVPDLDDTAAIRSGPSVLERLSEIQAELRDRIAQVTGRDVTRVNITITGAVVSGQRRVK